jgi:hypothetical protein
MDWIMIKFSYDNRSSTEIRTSGVMGMLAIPQLLMCSSRLTSIIIIVIIIMIIIIMIISIYNIYTVLCL